MARLPVEPETRRMLNQKPAKALGLTISQSVIRTIEMRNDWIARFALSSPMTIRETEMA